MPSDPTLPEEPEEPEEPKEPETVGLKLVNAESEPETSPDASTSTAGMESESGSSDRRRLPVWLFVAVLIIFSVAIGWQAQVASELEAEVAGLEAQIERTNALLDAHRSHLSEVRGGVHELSQSLLGLRALVDSDPEAVLPEEGVPTP